MPLITDKKLIRDKNNGYINIRMNLDGDDNFRGEEKHPIPHIHADHEGYKGTFNINTGDALGGNIISSESKIIKEWILKYKE
jgi:hypothetical protein